MSNPSRNPQWEAVATTAAATILTSVSGRATKIHTATPGGGWATQGYDRLHTFSAAPFDASDLRGFMASLVEASQHPQALLVAEVPHPASNWRRLPRRIHGSDPGLVRSLVGTQWVCWEVDGVAGEVPADVDPRAHDDRDADFVRWWMGAHLPPEFAAASAVLQWSASAFVGGKLSMHIWQWLDRPVSRESIHAYMEDHKHDDTPHWRRYIDSTIWDGARVHYIADPVFVGEAGEKLADPLKGRRWQWVQGEGGDEAAALPEWEDEAAWLERLGREAAAMEATKLQAAEERARRSSDEAGRRARGERPQEAAGDETGALLEVSCLGCRLEDLDPKRVLAWAQKAIRSGVAKINGAVAGDVVEGRHPAIREAGFVAGNILAGLDELDAALTPAVKSRVDWYSGVTAAERAVDELEAAAVAVGGADRARVLTWAVRIGRSTPVLPDYRTPEQYRQGAGGKVVSMKTKKVLPAYEGQPGIEVEVDEETGEVVDDAPLSAEAHMRAVVRRPWLSPPSQMDMALRVLEAYTLPCGAPPVTDGGMMWRYDPARSLWVSFGRPEIARLLAQWNGTETDEDKPKGIKIGASDVSGTDAICQSLSDKPGYFADAPMGIMLRGVFVRAGLKAITLEDPTPDHRARWAIDSAPADEMPALLQTYLDGAHEGDDAADKVRLMGEVLFAALTGTGVRFKKAVMCIGGKGTGKSQFIELLSRLVPHYAQTSIEPQQFGHDYHCAALEGAALNLVSDLEGGSIMREGRFKALVHGEPVPARKPKGEVFQLRPRALHVFAANALPPSPGASDAFWDRWVVVGFDRKFTVEGNSRALLGHAVADIGAAIAAEHMPELLGWIIRCGRDLVARGRYTIPSTAQAKLDGWKAAGDGLRAWLADSCEILDSVKTPKKTWASCKATHTIYAEWCRRFGYSPVNLYNFRDRLSVAGVANSEQSRGYVLCLRVLSDIGSEEALPF